MMTIERNRTLAGFATWTVMCDGMEVCTFDRYYDAVDFIRCMEEIEV